MKPELNCPECGRALRLEYINEAVFTARCAYIHCLKHSGQRNFEEHLCPCPNCDNTLGLWVQELGEINHPYYRIHCNDCNAQSDVYAGLEDLIREWNSKFVCYFTLQEGRK